MSNHKHAYGWSGHILTSSDENDSAPDDNLVAIPPDTFKTIVEAYHNCNLDERIHIEQLGVIDSEVSFLAAGSGFSDGFTYYGTVFRELEDRLSPIPPAIDHDAEYLRAMREIYKLDLPPCRLMVGCSSEH